MPHLWNDTNEFPVSDEALVKAGYGECRCLEKLKHSKIHHRKKYTNPKAESESTEMYSICKIQRTGAVNRNVNIGFQK